MYVVHMSGEKGGRAKPSGASRIGDPFGGISRSPLRRTRKEEELAGRRVPPRSDDVEKVTRDQDERPDKSSVKTIWGVWGVLFKI